MDELNQQEWEETVKRMQSASKEKRNHFAHLIMLLAQCYTETPSRKAVVVVDTGVSVLTFAAGADEIEMADLLMQANDTIQALTMQGAPSKEMFN